MFCFRVAMTDGATIMPVSPRYPDIREALRLYRHLSQGLASTLAIGQALHVVMYDGPDGRETAIKSYGGSELDALAREFEAPKVYTVVGYFADTLRPWSCVVMGTHPLTAASTAIRETADLNGYREIEDLRVVDILKGDCPSAESILRVLDGQEIATSAETTSADMELDQQIPSTHCAG